MNLVIALRLGALLCGVGMLAWAMPRGFDITDEAALLLAAQSPGDVQMMPRADFQITTLLFRAVNGHLVAYRLLGVGLTLLTALVCHLALRRVWFRWAPLGEAAGAAPWWEGTLIASTALMGYTWYMPTPSYNWMNGWAVTICAAAVSAALTEDRSGRLRVWGWMSAAGAAIALSFLVKFPTALALLGGSAVLVLAWPGWAIRRRMAALVALALGSGVVLTLFFTLLQSPSAWWAMFSDGFSNVTGHRPNIVTDLVLRYPKEIFDYVAAPGRAGLVAAVGALAAGLGVFGIRRRKGDTTEEAGDWAFATVVMAAAAASVAYFLLLDREQYFRHASRFSLAWLLLCLAGAAWRMRWHPALRLPAGRGPWLLMGAWMLAPFVGSFGSSNTINVNMLFSMAPWGALVILACRVMARGPQRAWVGGAVAVVVSGLCTAVVVGGAWTGPYRLNAALTAHTVPTPLGMNESILRLDPEASHFLTEVTRLARAAGFREGDDVLAFDNLPGAVFAMGGRSPGTPWYNALPELRSSFERTLGHIGTERVSRAWLLQTESSLAWLTSLPPGLGIAFPGGYELVGQLPVGYRALGGTVRIWKPHQIR